MYPLCRRHVCRRAVGCVGGGTQLTCFFSSMEAWQQLEFFSIGRPGESELREHESFEESLWDVALAHFRADFIL